MNRSTTLARLLLTLATGTLLLAAGCDTKEPEPPTHQEVTGLADKVQEQAIKDLYAISTCHKLGGEIAQSANQALEQWQFSNDTLVKAAEYTLGGMAGDWVEFKETPYSMETIRRTYTLSQQTEAQLNLAQRGPAARKSTCMNRLKAIESRSLAELAETPATAQVLVNEGNTSVDFGGAYSLQQALPEWPEPGKTYYRINSALQQTCPGQLTLIPLVNHWPEEAYAHYCDGNAEALVHCEWGQCQSQQPTATF